MSSELKLCSIGDTRDREWDDICAWSVAVWAPADDEALRYATDHYDGEYDAPDLKLEVLSRIEAKGLLQPERSDVHEELRGETLRLAGWREEGEPACEVCCLHAMGYERHKVCDGCCLCPTCRGEEFCPDCNPDPEDE